MSRSAGEEPKPADVADAPSNSFSLLFLLVSDLDPHPNPKPHTLNPKPLNPKP